MYLRLLEFLRCPSCQSEPGFYKAAGFGEVWPCNDGRRGFGVCGRDSVAASSLSYEASEQRASQVAPNASAQLMQGESA